MTVTIDKDIFVENLSLATKFTSTRSITTQALQGVCLEFEKGKLHIYSTNLNSFFHTQIPVKGEVEQRLVIEPRRIIEFLSLLSPGEVELGVEKNKIVCRQTKTKGVFEVSDAADFPQPPVVEEEPKSIPVAQLERQVPFVAFSASRDETRPALTAINFDQKENSQVMVSTDGFRLSLVPLKKNILNASALVPGEFLQEVVRQAKGKENMEIAVSDKEKTLKVVVGEKEFYTRLISEQFPPYEKVIPAGHTTTVTVSVDELIRAVKLVSIFARDVSNIVVMEVDKGTISVKPKHEGGDETGTSIEAVVEGDAMKTAFNYKFILDYLQHVQKKQITIELLRPDAPVVFRQEGMDGALHIIMPVRIQA